ncbi:MAG: AMP-binding protein [Clostridia bacterium]|nr:AMP-binding protein [Clostridia bacterium]
MKLSFSARQVGAPTFLALCKTAERYGYASIELSDADTVPARFPDGPFGEDRFAAKRKLNNRHLSFSAIKLEGAVGVSDGARVCAAVKSASVASVPAIVLTAADDADPSALASALADAIKTAESLDISILFETVGKYAKTAELLPLLHAFATGAVGAAWCVRATYFDGGEAPEDTITNLGAYINYVRLGDRRGGVDCLIGDGELPAAEIFAALRSLNYEGAIVCDGNAEISDPDIVLTHFAAFLHRTAGEAKKQTLYENRSKTGTFPWKRYDVIDKTFSQVLDTMAETYPDQYAFRYTTLDYTRTYRQFRDDVDEVAAALIAMGVKPGYHVAVWATNVPQWFITFWATVKIGAVLVTVNTAYKINEAEYLLRQSDTHTLVMIESCKDSNYKEIIEALCPELASMKPGDPLYSKKLPFLRNVVTIGFSMPGALTWDEMRALSVRVPREEVRRRAAAVRPDDVANMQYTSGTTGFPKGVMLTHTNIVNNGKIIGDRMDLSTADRMMIQVPMFHCFGMVLSMTSMMTHGGTLCPLPYFSPKSSLACITAEKITCFNGVPTMFIAMFAHADFAKTDFSHIRTGIMAGANCPPELMRRAADEMNMREIISVYGQTEASPGCTMGEVNEDIDHRVETVGSAFPGVECRIIDPETGEELPDGENGEFVARGYNIMKGYYKMPKATAAAIDKDGWLHSGDICCRTPDGYYKVTGRLKDMIIRGGENLYPREIEEFYLTNDKVRDVQVVGVPDKRYGEEACAWIILHKGQSATEEEMRAFGAAHIATHKVPRYFIFTDSFPMNAAGKILKYVMRDQSVEKLGLK